MFEVEPDAPLWVYIGEYNPIVYCNEPSDK